MFDGCRITPVFEFVEQDEELERTLETDYKELEEKVNQFEIYLLFDNEYDENSCTIDIHSGAGGTEACDWAEMLYRMYLRYCERKGYKVTIFDANEKIGGVLRYGIPEFRLSNKIIDKLTSPYKYNLTLGNRTNKGEMI